MAKVLIVYHTQSGNTKAAAEAVAAGAGEVADTEVVLKDALEADADDLRGCDAIAVGTPDYFSYMAGRLKDFFDRTLYPTQGDVTDKPCVIFVTHGGGGKAVDSVKSICASFKFKVITEPVLVKDRPNAEATVALKNLGTLLAAAASE